MKEAASTWGIDEDGDGEPPEELDPELPQAASNNDAAASDATAARGRAIVLISHSPFTGEAPL